MELEVGGGRHGKASSDGGKWERTLERTPVVL